MNNVINKFLIAGDKFMPEIYLRQPQFTYSACGPFTKHEQRIQKFKEADDTNYVYKNELDKACFVNDAFFDSKVSGSGAKRIPQYEQLVNELHKPIIRKFEKRRFIQHLKIIFGVLI